MSNNFKHTRPKAAIIERFDVASSSTEIDGNTRVMAIIGDPISQARTPQIINPIFKAMGKNIVCIPLRINADELAESWVGLKAMNNLVGFGVTIPHKNRAYELCDSLDLTAEKVGAVNVVRRETNGEFRGYQFDGTGFIRGLDSQNHDPRGMDCMVIGAGGAAAAIAFSLLEAGAASISIVNRTKSKALKLAEKLNKQNGQTKVMVGESIPKDYQLIVNATSLGMEEDDPYPMPIDLINSTMLVAEVVANPRLTRFLEAAAKQGATTHSGEYMVQNQVDLIAQHISLSG